MSTKNGTIKKDWVLADGTPVEHLPHLLNDVIPKKYPGYEVFQVIQMPLVMQDKSKVITGQKEQPVVYQMGYPLLKKVKE